MSRISGKLIPEANSRKFHFGKDSSQLIGRVLWHPERIVDARFLPRVELQWRDDRCVRKANCGLVVVGFVINHGAVCEATDDRFTWPFVQMLKPLQQMR